MAHLGIVTRERDDWYCQEHWTAQPETQAAIARRMRMLVDDD